MSFPLTNSKQSTISLSKSKIAIKDIINLKYRINLITINTFVPKIFKDLKGKKIKRRGTEMKVQYIMNLK